MRGIGGAAGCGAGQESGTYWFNPGSLEAETEFMLLGLVASLAIYNGAHAPLMTSRILVVSRSGMMLSPQQPRACALSIALCERVSQAGMRVVKID